MKIFDDFGFFRNLPQTLQHPFKASSKETLSLKKSDPIKLYFP